MANHKRELPKKDRKALEQEIRSNVKQRKENRKDMNRLRMFYILRRAKAFDWEDLDETPKAHGFRGMLI
jgi:arginine/lysine/ornithine decarboxylase